MTTRKRAISRPVDGFVRQPKYDRKCTKCGKAIYQGILCAACHCKLSNNNARLDRQEEARMKADKCADEHEANPIFTYTRQQAIEDGIFVDVTEVAEHLGFLIPIALTTNLYHTHIKKDDEAETQKRLTTFLMCLYSEIKHSKEKGNMLCTKIYFDDKTPTDVWAVIEAQSPEDHSPAMNVMLPEDY